MQIRPERPTDQAAIFDLNEAAFDTAAEAELVERLRESATPFISLVAIDGGAVLGHIAFSPASLYDDPALRLMGLAPMAVSRRSQGQGIGSKLVRAGLERCRKLNTDAVVVLGHPDYYPRFGFEPASERGLSSEYEVPDEAFMLLELNTDSLAGKTGLVSYHPAFATL